MFLISSPSLYTHITSSYKYYRYTYNGLTLIHYAYPSFQNISILSLVSSFANSCCSAKLKLSPCNSSTFPVSDESLINLSAALIAVCIGVRAIESNNALSGAILVADPSAKQYKTRKHHNEATHR